MVSLFASMPMAINTSASITHNVNLTQRICAAAKNYNNRYYGEITSRADWFRQREYTRWMNLILSHRVSSPGNVFLPKDMFDAILNELGLSVLPLNTFRCLDFLFALRMKAYRSLRSHLKGNPDNIQKLYLCCPSANLLNGTDHLKILRSGAIMKATDDGMLMLRFRH